MFALLQGVPRHPTTAVTSAKWPSVDHQLVIALLIGIRKEKRENCIYHRFRYSAVFGVKLQGILFLEKLHMMGLLGAGHVF